MRLVLLGPPGSGKGTQAATLSARLRVPHISTGEMLRDAIRRGTEAGAAAEGLVAAGRLVPDDLVRRIVEERLAREDTRTGFILDGYPRNLAQARELESILSGARTALDRVVELVAAEELLVRRLSGRRTCTGCGRVFHVELNRPRSEGACDACGGTLVQREDDREAVIRERLRVHREATAPLADYYRERGLLASIPAGGPVEEVSEGILAALGARR